MAGVSSTKAAPYPNGGGVVIPIGGYAPNGLAANSVLGAFYVPWDCWVKSVTKYYKGGTAHLDGIRLYTVDDTKDLVAMADASADVDGVRQTLDADIIGYQIQAGDVIKLLVDSAGNNEAGWIMFYIELVPWYQVPVAQQR